jgi:two-component system chemotaxis response regulator CheB
VNNRVKILIVDDSRFMRRIVSDFFLGLDDLEVLGTVGNGKEALDFVKHTKPDLITLDVEMPVMDGLTFLDELRKAGIKIPVIMLSVLTREGAQATFKALELGAYDFVPKPSTELNTSIKEIQSELIEKIRSIAYKKLAVVPGRKVIPQIAVEKPADLKLAAAEEIELVGIGCSTGGPAALAKILPQFPADFPLPILIVQHMPDGFTKLFANRLDKICALTIKEVEHLEEAVPGVVYIARGNYHLKVLKKNEEIHLQLDKEEKLVNNHRPSIDVLFNSMYDILQGRSIAVILTGMGRDGSAGMLKLKNSGSYTVGQDEESSVIYGMNKQAKKIGAVTDELPLGEIIPGILKYLKLKV